MPLTPEEPQIHESVPGPRTTAGSTRTPQAPRPAASVPGPRPSPRPAQRADSKGPGSGRPGTVRSGGASSPRTAPSAPTAQIQLVAATDETAVEAADDTVDKLLDDGREPGEVLVITTGEQHPWAQHELSFGEDAYWRQLADGEDVFCAHAAAIGRLTGRPVVVLAVNGGTDAEAAQALPAALEKAGAELIVCGNPQRLAALL
ncbi:hypothetical protein [Streptomyces sp. ODS28]|uniref:hypothetical protein n=1 Tax=Streptomyces sp. ODS28 TaxID=3136688 RepID=UPI0031EDC1A8